MVEQISLPIQNSLTRACSMDNHESTKVLGEYLTVDFTGRYKKGFGRFSGKERRDYQGKTLLLRMLLYKFLSSSICVNGSNITYWLSRLTILADNATLLD